MTKQEIADAIAKKRALAEPKDDVEIVSIRTKPEEIDDEAKPMIIVR